MHELSSDEEGGDAELGGVTGAGSVGRRVARAGKGGTAGSSEASAGEPGSEAGGGGKRWPGPPSLVLGSSGSDTSLSGSSSEQSSSARLGGEGVGGAAEN